MPEPEEQFCDRFNRLFGSHIDVLVKKDFPVLIAHMSECGNCEDCPTREGCEIFVERFLKLRDQLPRCIQKQFSS